jgi:hypothetical protein
MGILKQLEANSGSYFSITMAGDTWKPKHGEAIQFINSLSKLFNSIQLQIKDIFTNPMGNIEVVILAEYHYSDKEWKYDLDSEYDKFISFIMDIDDEIMVDGAYSNIHYFDQE